MNRQDWNGVESAVIGGSFPQLEPGGYVCKVIHTKCDQSKNGKEMLVIEFDVAEGQKAGFFGRQFQSEKLNSDNVKWRCVYRQLTEGNSQKFYKGLINLFEKSNPGYNWDWNESSLIGKIIGCVFGEEEYAGNDGKVYTTVRVQAFKMPAEIRDGNFTVPTKKTIKPSAVETAFGVTSSYDDIPF